MKTGLTIPEHENGFLPVLFLLYSCEDKEANPDKVQVASFELGCLEAEPDQWNHL